MTRRSTRRCSCSGELGGGDDPGLISELVEDAYELVFAADELPGIKD
ncbi:MAG: hypothetical protein ABSA14_13105 [Acidimicrobiales bacterium]